MNDYKIKLKPLNQEKKPTFQEVDYLIIGGGCAGLGLAVNLINSDLKDKKILILEARHEYKRDKTWCSWGVFEHQFQQVISKTWSKFQFLSSNNQLILSSQHHPYQHINSLDYYQYALRVIENTDNVQLHMNSRVHSLDINDKSISVESNIGTLKAKYVFDGRPPPLPDENTLQEKLGTYVIQRFLGLHIIVDEPVFNENIATIMDSNISSDGAAFYYVLPFNQYEALVEPTFFLKSLKSAQEFTQDKLKDYVDSYLNQHGYSGKYKIIYKETDWLPMLDFLIYEKHPHKRIYTIGTAAGLLQPGTGYAFNNIQRYNQELVRLLTLYEFPDPPDIFSNFIKNIDNYSLRRLVKIATPNEYLDAMIIPTWSNIEGDIYARFMHDCLTQKDMAVLTRFPSFQLFI